MEEWLTRNFGYLPFSCGSMRLTIRASPKFGIHPTDELRANPQLITLRVRRYIHPHHNIKCHRPAGIVGKGQR